MHTDNFGLVVNHPENYKQIAQVLSHGSALISWTDGGEVQFDILFDYLPVTPQGFKNHLQGGIEPTYLFVSIMRLGAFAFKVGNESHGDYYAEKLGIPFDGGTRTALADLINGVRKLL